MEVDSLPWITSAWSLLGLFVALVVLLHVALISIFSLGKIGWKKADYVWLGFALIGALSSVAGARQLFAERLLEDAGLRVEAETRNLQRQVQFGTSEAICRTFVRSEFSPPPAIFDPLQREFDQQCAWFKSASAKLPSGKLSGRSPLVLSDFGSPIPTGGDRDVAKWFVSALDNYNSTLTRYLELSTATTRTDFEKSVGIMGPLLAVAALALRLTKVTGEIRLG